MQYTGLCTMPLNSVLKTHTDTILDCIYYAFFVLLPLTGWAAESWLGRYRAILVGLILSAVTVVLFQITFVMLQLEWTLVPELILSTVAMSLGLLGFGSLYTNILPFTKNQLIGVLAKELSAVVQWYYWGFINGELIRHPSLYSSSSTVTVPGHGPNGFTCGRFSVFVGCPDNCLSIPQVVRHE